jgi:hypothetical protein
MIRCKKCTDAIYIGETCQTQNVYLPVGEHFNKPMHNTEDMRITVLKGFIPDLKQRQIIEQKLIQRF